MYSILDLPILLIKKITSLNPQVFKNFSNSNLFVVLSILSSFLNLSLNS